MALDFTPVVERRGTLAVTCPNCCLPSSRQGRSSIHLGGCARDEPLPSAPCWPDFTVAPEVAPRGSEIRVSSGGFRCDFLPHGGSTKTYRIVLAYANERFEPVEKRLGTVTATASGSFDVTVRIPDDAPLRDVAIYARGSRVDRCMTHATALLVRGK